MDGENETKVAISHCALCEDSNFIYRDCLLAAATAMRNKCVEKMKAMRDGWWATYNSQPESVRDAQFMKGMDAAAGQLLAALMFDEEQGQDSPALDKPKKVNLGGGSVKIT